MLQLRWWLAFWLAGLLIPAAWGQPRRPPGTAPGRGPTVAGPRPGAALDRLSRMPPEQRRRVLEQLPAERRKRIEERLERYNSLPPEERERLREQLERFRDLSPERQEAARSVFRRFLSLPEDRRQLLREEFRRLQELDPARRRTHIQSEDFRSRYTPVERRLLRDYAELLGPPS